MRVSCPHAAVLIPAQHARDGASCWTPERPPAPLTSRALKHQLFDNYEIASAAGNVINLEVPLAVLTRALKSCAAASDVVLRLTKRQSDKCPILSLTIITAASHSFARGGSNTLVTQEVPVRVLSSASVDSIVEPRAPAPSVLIQLPPLGPVRSVSERFLRIGGQEGKVAISANKEGRFRMRFDADEVKIESCWRNQQNMEAEPVDGSAVARPTQEQRRQFKEVLVDCKEWVKVLKVSNLAKRVVACMFHLDGRGGR